MSSSFAARNWRDLIKPKSVPVEDASSTYGKFVCEPLERGFGITLGNALRRVLLSSLQGAAITAIKVDGALHEFTSVPDVVEDVTDIVLNLKEVVVKAHSPKNLSQFQERRLAEAKQLKDDLRQFRQELSIYVFGK